MDGAPGAPLSGAGQARRDARNHFWDEAGGHVRPTGGAGVMGVVDPARNRLIEVWEMEQYATTLYWDMKIGDDPSARARIAANWAYLKAAYPATGRTSGLASDGSADGTIGYSDDAAWKCLLYSQAGEATGEARCLTALEGTIRNVLTRFADPDAPRVGTDGLCWSKYGILYATGHGTGHDSRASLYEVMLALGALHAYDHIGRPAFHAYASYVWTWAKAYLRDPAKKIYYCELDLARRNPDGSANAHYLRPIGDYFGVPAQGLSAHYIGGTMAMAVLSARLYRARRRAGAAASGEVYLAEALSICDGVIAMYVAADGALLNDRDPFTDGTWGPYFVDEVLTLPGADPRGVLRSAFVRTAETILATRTAEGFYSAEWSANTKANALGYSSYEQQGRATGMPCTPAQIMITGNALSMIQAGRLAAGKSAGALHAGGRAGGRQGPGRTKKAA